MITKRESPQMKPHAEHRRRVLTCGLVVGLVLATLAGVPAVAVADDTPAVPASYYGSVTVDGEPAPVGTEIDAVVDGDVQDTITVEEAGQYGGPGPFDEKLVVDDAEAGDTVEFQIDGEPAEETVEWEPGDVREVDLTFEASATEDEENGDDEPGAPGGGAPGNGGQDGGDPGEDPPADTDPAEPAANATAAIDTDPDATEAQATFEDTPVEAVTFEEAVGANETATVTERDEPPADAGTPPGAELTMVTIDVPDTLTDTAASITTTVTDEELEAVDATPTEVQLYHQVEETWQPLETTVVEERDDGAVLEAVTEGFSTFAVSAVSTPTAVLTAPETATIGEEVVFDASEATDEYGEITAIEWTIDGETATGETVTTTFDEPGDFGVELTVTNDAGETDTVTETVTIEADDEAPADADEEPPGDDESQPAEEESDGPLSSFGALAAVVAVVIAVILYVRRR